MPHTLEAVATEDKIPETVIERWPNSDYWSHHPGSMEVWGSIPRKSAGLMELARGATFPSVIGTNNGIGGQGLVLHGTARNGALPAQARERRNNGLIRLNRARCRTNSAAISEDRLTGMISCWRHQAIHYQRHQSATVHRF